MTIDLTFEKSVFNLSGLPDTGLPEVCVSGRSNVGKSSLINKLSGQKKLAKTSSTPGKTRSLNYYNAGGKYYLVDLPGYGYARVPKKERAVFAELVDPYLHQRAELMGFIQLIDARHGPVSGDHMMLDWLADWDGRILFVFTKADKLSGNKRQKVEKEYRREFGAENIVLFSAVTGRGREDIISWIEDTLGISGETT